MSEILKSNLTKEDIVTNIKDFIVQNFMFGNDSEGINPDDSFMENGIIDSTGILELIEYSEETFGISIDDSELIPENLDSLNNISNFILLKRS